MFEVAMLTVMFGVVVWTLMASNNNARNFAVSTEKFLKKTRFS